MKHPAEGLTWQEIRHSLITKGLTLWTDELGSHYVEHARLTLTEEEQEAMWQRFLRQSLPSWKDEFIPGWREMQEAL